MKATTQDGVREKGSPTRRSVWSASSRAARSGRSTLGSVGAYQSGGLFVALIILALLFTFLNSNFLTTSNLTVVLLQVTSVGLVAIPAGMLLLAGYLDLSVGSMAALSAAVFGLAAKDLGLPLIAAVVLALGLGSGWGALNGYVIAYLGFSPIVVTLAGFAGARGLAEAVTQSQTRFGFGPTFAKLGNANIGPLPVPVVLFIGIFLVGVYLWYGTPLGRHLTAIGADPVAARAVGVSVRVIPLWVYIASGATSALTGLIITSQLDGASPSIGVGLELQVLTAVLLGGVAFSGGRGSLWGVLFGVLFVGVLNNGLVLMNVGPYFVNVAVGAVLFVVAGIDVIYQRLEKIPPAGADDDTHVTAPDDAPAEVVA